MKTDFLTTGCAGAALKLKDWQSEAKHVRVAPKTCPRCRSTFYLTYTTPLTLLRVPIDETLEHCGYFCGSCRLASFGARKKK